MDIRAVLEEINISCIDRKLEDKPLAFVDSLIHFILRVINYKLNDYDDYYKIYWKNENIQIISKMINELNIVSSLNDFDMFIQKYFFHLSFIFIYSKNNFVNHIFLSNIRKWNKYLEKNNLESMTDNDILKFMKCLNKLFDRKPKISDEDYSDLCICFLKYKFDNGDTRKLFELAIKYNSSILLKLIRNDMKDKFNEMLSLNNLSNIEKNIDNIESIKLLRILKKIKN